MAMLQCFLGFEITDRKLTVVSNCVGLISHGSVIGLEKGHHRFPALQGRSVDLL